MKCDGFDIVQALDDHSMDPITIGLEITVVDCPREHDLFTEKCV